MINSGHDMRELDEQSYPVAITLRFRTVEDKNLFMGGLSDGWGENACALSWDTSIDPNWDSDPNKPNYAFEVADTFLVDPFNDDGEDEDADDAEETNYDPRPVRD